MTYFIEGLLSGAGAACGMLVVVVLLYLLWTLARDLDDE